jgi:thiol-disulfide isomerase/thioredoxin
MSRQSDRGIRKLHRVVMAGLAASVIGLASLSAHAGQEISGPAPAFSLPTNTGASDSLANHRGDVVMINFWASWCEPCRTEFPLIDALYKKYKKLGFTVLAVNIEPDAKAAQGFLKNTPVSFPVLMDSKNTVSDTYKVDAMPTTVMVDRNGNQRFLHRGYQPGYEAEYEKNIRALLRE